MQGEGAAAETSRALAAIARVPGVDVVIVGRGGGSIEDLWAFNEEAVARAIAQSPVPVISAVGHETDFTIADFVADLRAPTPSAAAEMVVAGKDEFCARIDRLAGRLTASARRASSGPGPTAPPRRQAGAGGVPGRLALRGRHVAELTHQLGRAGRTLVARRERRYHELRLRSRRSTCGAGSGPSAPGWRAWTPRSARPPSPPQPGGRPVPRAGRPARQPQPAGGPRPRLRRVLGRDRTRIIRDAATVNDGDGVRVTVQRGELEARVTGEDG